MQNKKRTILTFGVFVLMLAALACTCGPLSQAQEALATGQAAATQVNEALPTLQAAATDFEGAMTQAAPTLTAAALTLQASGIDLTSLPGLPTTEPGGDTGGGESVEGAFDGGDGYRTEFVRPLQLGQPQNATLTDLFAAHNWEFEGTAGQSVTITVTPVGDTDPRIKLIGPTGDVLGDDDDSGGNYASLLTFTLPANGTYTVRVDVFSGGEYTILVQ